MKKILMDFLYKMRLCAVFDKKRRREYRRRYDMQKKLPEYKNLKQEWASISSVPLVPARFSEYDLVFAIGCDCMMTYMLTWHELRSFSNPFDWTDGCPPLDWCASAGVWRNSRFREKIDALCGDFVDYFNPKDLQPYSSNIAANEHLPVANVCNGVRFLHLFDVDKSMESQMEDVCAKIERRAQRLLNAIDKSNRILICWGHSLGDLLAYLNAPVSDADIKYAVDKLREKWPDKEFDIVFFEHDGRKAKFEYDKIHVCGGAYRIRSNHLIYAKEYRAKYLYPRHSKYRQPHLVVAEALDNIRLSVQGITDKMVGSDIKF